MRIGSKVSRTGFARFLLLTGLVSFACALLRNAALSGVFEVLKFPILAAAIGFQFYLRPVIRLSVASATMWSFFAVVATSTVYNSANSPGFIASIAIFFVIAVYFQAINNVTEPESLLNPLLWWFAVGIVATSSFYALLPASFIGGRFAAGFINTNVAAGFIVIAIVVLSYMVIFEKPPAFFFLFLAAAVFLLLLTKGRGALIAVVVPVAVMLFTDFRKRSSRRNLIRVAGIALALWLSIKIDISGTTNATELSVLSYRAFELGAREAIVERHFSAFWHSPLIGAGAVIDEAAPYARTSGESSYTDLLALSGGVGMFLIGIIIIRALWVHWHHTKSRLGFYVLLSTLLLASSEGYFVSIASAVSMIMWALLAVSPPRAPRNYVT